MTRISLLETAHTVINRHMSNGGLALDATIGNGYDTVFLAHQAGAEGHVYGFDIQAVALANTRQRLQACGLVDRTSLFQASHAEMLNFIPETAQGKIQAVMFNLGYLPGADKTLITQSASTLAAVDAACRLLADRGVITVLAYPGHTGGDLETRSLAVWCRQADCMRQFQSEVLFSDHHHDRAPQLFVIRKASYLL